MMQTGYSSWGTHCGESDSDRPARADCVVRAILEPRASSHEHRIVVTPPVPRRLRTMPHHAVLL